MMAPDLIPTVPETGVEPRESPSLTAALAALADFRKTHPKEIISLLRQLARHRNVLNVSFGRNGERIVTRILDVDEASGSFLYDYGAGNAENLRFQQSEENLFSGMQAGVHIKFVCGRAAPDLHDGLPAFKSQLPESLYRIQRRENFRVEMPIADPYVCTATLPNQRRVRFNLVDLSLTGVRLRSADVDPDGDELAIGTTLTGATFDYRDLGTMESDLKIIIFQNAKTSTDPIYHFGCRFLTLPKAKEASLQRFITFLELRRNKR